MMYAKLALENVKKSTKDYLIYLPFFKVYEKQELESEQEVNTLRKEETNG